MDIFEGPSGESSEAATPEEAARFVTAAGVQAPSVHNTQPWRFSHRGNEIELSANNERQLRIADPDGREMFISCGAALFNVRVALRCLGLVPDVQVLPDHRLVNVIARVSWAERVPAVEYEQQLFAQISRRRTHRGGFGPAPVPPELLKALPGQAAKEKARLDLMDGEPQRAAVLAAVVEAGDGAAAGQRPGQGGGALGAGPGQSPARRRPADRLSRAA